MPKKLATPPILFWGLGKNTEEKMMVIKRDNWPCCSALNKRKCGINDIFVLHAECLVLRPFI